MVCQDGSATTAKEMEDNVSLPIVGGAIVDAIPILNPITIPIRILLPPYLYQNTHAHPTPSPRS